MFSFHNYFPIADSEMEWGCRAIFDGRSEQRPLDILWDRQGGSVPEDKQALFEQFADVINKTVLPELQKLGKYFSSDSSDKLVKHFSWPHDDSKVLVAIGSPNRSYGYFYLSIHLVAKAKAPDEQKPSRQAAEEKREQDRAEWAVRQRELEAKCREQRQQEKVAAEAAKLKFYQRFDDRKVKRHGQNLEPGDCVRIWANQGMRDAVVLSIADGHALVEYQMPKGVTFLSEIDVLTQEPVRSVNRNKIPKKWGLKVA